MGTLIFSRNYAKGTFIREGTFIRQCIVSVNDWSHVEQANGVFHAL